MGIESFKLNVSRKGAEKKIVRKIETGDFSGARDVVGDRMIRASEVRNRVVGKRSEAKGKGVYDAESQVENSAVRAVKEQLGTLASGNPKKFMEAVDKFRSQLTSEDIPQNAKENPALVNDITEKVASMVEKADVGGYSQKLVEYMVEPFTRLGVVSPEEVFRSPEVRVAAQKHLEAKREKIRRIGSTRSVETLNRFLEKTRSEYISMGILTEEESK